MNWWETAPVFYRPAQEDRDWIVVHHRVPGVSKPALMISLCAACHAYQLALPIEPERAAGALVAVAFNPKVVELDV
jgi:hypothetical protein